MNSAGAWCFTTSEMGPSPKSTLIAAEGTSIYAESI